MVGVLLVPDVADALRGSPPRTRLLASLAFVVVVAAVAQAVGAAIGGSLSARLGRMRAGALRQGDRVAGGALGVAGVLVLDVAAHPCARELAGMDGARGARQRGRRA